MPPVVGCTTGDAEAPHHDGPTTHCFDDCVYVHEHKLADFLTGCNCVSPETGSFPFTPAETLAVILPAMETTLEKDVARRLKAVREELGMDQRAMAKWLDVGRTRYIGWERAANLPNERVMLVLCDRTGLTLDYVYRGRLDAVPLALAIRVTAREDGLDPDAPGFQAKIPVMAVRPAKLEA